MYLAVITQFLAARRHWLKTHPWDAIFMTGVGFIGLATGLWASAIILDDALITFRVAENLAFGRGFVYNVGERVQVTTTPLYTMVLAIGVWIFGDAPRAALGLNLALSALIPMLAYDLGRRLAGWITGIGGALLVTTTPLLIIAFSMESYLYVALILASMDAYLADRLRLSGILTGVTALVRGDAALLGATLLSYDVLDQRRLRWPLLLPAIGLPALWYVFAMFYYGNPLPATLGAKVAQGEFDWLGQGFLEGFYEHWDHWVRIQNLETFYIIPVFMILGILVTLRTERPWLILVARDALYVAAFVGLGVPAAPWYYAPLMPGVAMLTARGIQLLADSFIWILNKLTQHFRKRLLPARAQLLLSGAILAGALTISLSNFYPAAQFFIDQNPDWKAEIYPDAARWIAQNTNASANLATIDIGHLGYWSDRQIIDIVGLAQPDVAAKIAEGDFGYAIQRYQPDMVLIGFSWLPEIQSQAWFQTDYTLRHYFKYRNHSEPLMLFSRRQGVKVQTNLIPPAAIQPFAADFNRQISLTGYHLNRQLQPGAPLNLTLFWKAVAPVEIDFTVFVQMVDDQNKIMAQKDSKPQHGFYGTIHWRPGETIIDSHTIPLGLEISPGAYDLVIGFYEVESGLRLQILDEAGQFKSDHIRISDINIRELNQ